MPEKGAHGKIPVGFRNPPILMKHTLISLVILLALLGSPRGAAAKQLTAYANPATPGQVIAAINAYRAANGLYSYTQNSTLALIAQGQSDYQASIGSVTHEGPGGTRPRDRAIAAGYGGGATVFVSEIIYGGGDGSVETAITWWKNSPLHNDQMLASTYIEIGAGVASNGSRNYYTAVMGYVAGAVPAGIPGENQNNVGGNNSGSSGDASSAPPTVVVAAAPAVVIIPAIAATPQADGSIVHIIRTGQALWNVAAVYDVPLQTILELNGLPEWAFVHPGDEILVRPATGQTSASPPAEAATESTGVNAPAGQETPAAESTPQPTSSGPVAAVPSGGGRQTPVIGEAVVIAAGGEESEAATDLTGGALEPGETDTGAGAPREPGLLDNPAARWVVIIAFAAILAVVALGAIPSRTAQRPPDDDPVR